MLVRYLSSIGPVIQNGVSTWVFPNISQGDAAQLTFCVPSSPQSSLWSVYLNALLVSSLTGTAPYGPLYVQNGDQVTISGTGSDPSLMATAIGVLGGLDEIAPLVPVLGGGIAQSVTVNATELQGIMVSGTPPLTNQGLVFDGTAWTPEAIVNSVPVLSSFITANVGPISSQMIIAQLTGLVTGGIYLVTGSTLLTTTTNSGYFNFAVSTPARYLAATSGYLYATVGTAPLSLTIAVTMASGDSGTIYIVAGQASGSNVTFEALADTVDGLVTGGTSGIIASQLNA